MQTAILLNIIVGAVVVLIIIFAIVSAIRNRKNRHSETNKRQREIAEQIKKFARIQHNYRNLRADFEKMVARRGQVYRYREIYDVLIAFFNAKTNKLISHKAFEVEGINKEIAPKQYQTFWRVNRELDYEEAHRNIMINEGKIRLSRAEQKLQKRKAREYMKKMRKLKKTNEKQQRQVIKRFRPRTETKT